jgi:hypothetical protein
MVCVNVTTPTHKIKQENGWGNGFMHEGQNITIKCFCTHQQQGSLFCLMLMF